MGFTYNHFADYEGRILENSKLDEMMIANIIGALNNPNVVKLCTEEELAHLLLVVKNHALCRSYGMAKVQDAFLQGVEREKNKSR